MPRAAARCVTNATLIASLHAAGAFAQQPQTIEEVVVTAQKRAESLQSAPLSISALGSQQLETMGVNDLADIQHNVPSLSMRQFPNAKSTLRVFIRGVGNNDSQLSQDPGVGVYVDGVYMARSTGLAMELAELERIEVLRGPQGSLYGRNTTGGAVNVITRKPSGEWRFKQKVTLGNRGLWQSATDVDLPQLGDLALQLNYHTGAVDGVVKNHGNGLDFGEEDRSAYRVAARWTPLAELTVDYTYDRSDIDSGAPYYQTLQPGAPGFEDVPWSAGRIESTTSSQALEKSQLTISGHSLHLAWDFSDQMTLRWISAYRELDESVYQDYSANPVTPRLFSNDPFETEQEQWSHELQLVGSSATIDYVAGLYYFKEEGSEYSIDRISLAFGPGGSLVELPLQSRLSDVTSSAKAAFGQMTWTPQWEQRLHVTAGLRYTQDKRELSVDRFQALDTNTFQTNAKDTFERVSPALTVAWDISEDVNAYLRWTEGYRSGAFNSRADSVTAATRPVSEEIVETVELGVKSEWLNRRLRLNASAYTSDFKDMQLGFTLPENPSAPVFFNAGSSSINGVELDVTALLLDELMLTLGYGFIDSDVEKVTDPVTGVDVSDEYELASAPRHSYTVDLDYRFPALSIGTLHANLNYAWKDEQRVIFNLGGPLSGLPLNEPYNQIDSYGIWNARLSLEEISLGSGELTVALWGKNLADEEYLVDGVVNFHWSPKVGVFGDPRSYGVDLIYRWQ